MVPNVRAPVRVVVLALAISALSFAAGMAGDLSAPPPPSGPRVVAVIPSPQAAHRPQAAHLLATSSAQALTPDRVARRTLRTRRVALLVQAPEILPVSAPKSQRTWSRPPDPKPAFADLVKQDFVKA